MKTSDLIGPALDWAVAKCAKKLPISHQASSRHWWSPSTNWNHGGPIIERERIELHTADETLWSANLGDPFGAKRRRGESLWSFIGPTPLIAAMRCFCCAKLGDEIDIPEELQ